MALDILLQDIPKPAEEIASKRIDASTVVNSFSFNSFTLAARAML